jgi:hypothetical protein
LERNPPHGVMQPCGLRPEQEAAVSLICSPRRNTPATGSWSSLPRDGAAPPTKDGSPCPRRLQRPRPLPQRRVTHRLPRRGDRFAARAVRRAVTPLRGPGPRRRRQAVVGLLGCYERFEAMRRRLSSPEERTGPGGECGSDRLADHGPGVRSSTPSLGFPIFRQKCSETPVRWCKMRAARGPRMLLRLLAVPAERGQW